MSEPGHCGKGPGGFYSLVAAHSYLVPSSASRNCSRGSESAAESAWQRDSSSAACHNVECE
eukprot:139676-Hanusia_phi.AAC.1